MLCTEQDTYTVYVFFILSCHLGDPAWAGHRTNTRLKEKKLLVSLSHHREKETPNTSWFYGLFGISHYFLKQTKYKTVKVVTSYSKMGY